MDCCRTNASDLPFDPRIARRELKRFRKRGPERSTRLLEHGFSHATDAPAAMAVVFER